MECLTSHSSFCSSWNDTHCSTNLAQSWCGTIAILFLRYHVDVAKIHKYTRWAQLGPTLRSECREFMRPTKRPINSETAFRHDFECHRLIMEIVQALFAVHQIAISSCLEWKMYPAISRHCGVRSYLSDWKSNHACLENTLLSYSALSFCDVHTYTQTHTYKFIQ